MDGWLRGTRVGAPLLVLLMLSGCAGLPTGSPAQQVRDEAQVAPEDRPAGAETPPGQPVVEPPAAATPARPAFAVLDRATFETDRERLRQQLALAERASPAGHDAGYYLDVLQARLQQLGGGAVAVQRQDERIVLTMPGRLGFEVGRAQLDERMREPLAAIAAVLVDYRMTLVSVHGHSDDSGPDELNRRLSEQRAMAVGRVLVEGGVEPKRVVVIGHGPARPLAPNETPEGRERNRRVEIELELIAR